MLFNKFDIWPAILVVTTLYLAGAHAKDGDTLACVPLLNGLAVLENDMYVRAPGSGISVSLASYQLDFVLENLGLRKEELRAKFAGRRVLLVGEGFGELLQALIAAGADVVSIDPLYAFAAENLRTDAVDPAAQVMFSHIQQFFAEYRPWLKAGTAQNIPFANGTFDFHMTHLVYNNFVRPDKTVDRDLLFPALRESFRILKRGGQSLSVTQNHQASLEDVSNLLGLRVERSEISSYSVRSLGPKQLRFREENGPRIFQFGNLQMNLARIEIRK